MSVTNSISPVLPRRTRWAIIVAVVTFILSIMLSNSMQDNYSKEQRNSIRQYNQRRTTTTQGQLDELKKEMKEVSK